MLEVEELAAEVLEAQVLEEEPVAQVLEVLGLELERRRRRPRRHSKWKKEYCYMYFIVGSYS
jgi:hypothetical protein